MWRITTIAVFWGASLSWAHGQGDVNNAHSVEAIRAALNLPIPAGIQQQAQQFDNQMMQARKTPEGITIVTVVTDYRYNRVNQIVTRLLRALGTDPSKWVVRVLDTDPKAENAFTFGGTYFYVYTLLLENAQSDDELAFAFAHEISHSLLKHGVRKGSDSTYLLGSIIELGSQLLRNENTREKVGLVGGTITAAYSREDEQEADALGAYIANRAGYDPARGIDFFNRSIQRENSNKVQTQTQRTREKQAVDQHIANCERLRAQWNSSPAVRTPQNAQIVNTACQNAQTKAQQYNELVSQDSKNQIKSLLTRGHPWNQERITALAASLDYLRGKRSLQSLSNVGQGYNVFVAMNLNNSSRTSGNQTSAQATSAAPNPSGQMSIDLQNCASNEGVVDDRIAACTRAITSGQLSSAQLAQTFNNRGITWGRKDDNERAIADFNEAIKLNSQSENTYYNRGIAWAKKGDNERAIADFNEAIKLNPQSVNAYIGRGIIWNRKGDYERAIADFDEAIRLNPQSASAYDNRGNIWSRRGDYERAMTDYNEAIRLNPQSVTAYNNGGRAQFYSGQFEDSAAYFAQSLRLNRDQPYIVIWRYLSQARNQSTQSANSELSASMVPLDKQKWPAPVIELLAGRLDPSTLLKAAESSDSDVKRNQLCEAKFNLGEWHLLNRRPTEARDWLQSAVRDCPATFIESTAATVELRRLGK